MKQPKTTEDIVIFKPPQILTDSGTYIDDEFSDPSATGFWQTVSRSIALEGQPTGQAKPGPINRCPITGDVLYQSDMIEYLGRYYSSEGLQEVTERDSLRNN